MTWPLQTRRDHGDHRIFYEDEAVPTRSVRAGPSALICWWAAPPCAARVRGLGLLEGVPPRTRLGACTRKPVVCAWVGCMRNVRGGGSLGFSARTIQTDTAELHPPGIVRASRQRDPSRLCHRPPGIEPGPWPTRGRTFALIASQSEPPLVVALVAACEQRSSDWGLKTKSGGNWRRCCKCSSWRDLEVGCMLSSCVEYCEA